METCETPNEANNTEKIKDKHWESKSKLDKIVTIKVKNKIISKLFQLRFEKNR